LLPEAVVREGQQFRSYAPNERSIYLKLRISSGLGLKNPKIGRVPKTARKFLFVCFGNIMRSPMCEYLMNRELIRLDNQQFAVTSAGLNATPGRSAHPWALAAAREFNISLEHHRARLLTREIVDQADAIFAMDYQNQVQLLSRWPSAGNKLFMLAAYSSQEYRSVEISDPYYLGQQQTRCCFEILNTCIQNLAGGLAD
jgi:protein-tyrosine phosphatase